MKPATTRYLTRAPKGIFFYRNHDEMIRDRERWTVDAVVARHAEILSRALAELKDRAK